MTISDYQIGSVVKTYMKNLRVKLKEKEDGLIQKPTDDEVLVSQEGMRKVLYDRINVQIVERSKKHDQK
jgi:hypothetical protein